jgi:glucose/arabinose dehydrogenase
MMGRRLVVVLLFLSLAGCDKDDPPSPDPGTPSGDVQVSAGDRLGWSQPAGDLTELSTFQYALYVDGTRTALSATCAASATTAGFACSAVLPVLALGAHTLELAAFVVDGSVTVESPRSPALRVVAVGPAAVSSSTGSAFVTTAEQVQLTLTPVVDGLHQPTDLAFTADGAIFVAERGGIVRVIKQNALVETPALDLSGEVRLPEGGLLAIALDSKFDENGRMFALYAAAAPRNGVEFTLARFRGVDNKFGERAILLDRIPASPEAASGALRLGPDGKLYVALDSVADPRGAASFGSYNGKVLRLNTDATTPDDQPGLTPIYSLDHPQPRAMSWQPGNGALWVVDQVEAFGGRLSAVTGNERQRGTSLKVGYSLPEGTGASSVAFYTGERIPIFHGNLFVAAERGRQLIRLRFDPDNGTRIVSVDRLLKDQIGPIRVVGEGRDGALYLVNDTTLYRLVP